VESRNTALAAFAIRFAVVAIMIVAGTTCGILQVEKEDFKGCSNRISLLLTRWSAYDIDWWSNACS
jgi:hypothetical protein